MRRVPGHENKQGTSNNGAGIDPGEAGVDNLSRWSGVRTGRGGKVLYTNTAICGRNLHATITTLGGT